ncbi:MAG: YjjI family glycine radical enzyme [Actinomycetes bacterium]
MKLDEHRRVVRGIVDDPTLTYRQRIQSLALAAENLLDPPKVSDDCATALAPRVICDMYEGAAPHRPRYTLPDYERAMRTGSEFLELAPPTSFDDATTFLLALYGNVPSITGYPVWFGDIDRLLEPFAAELDDAELRRRLRRFWTLLDRLFPDAFAHANLGPADGRVVRAALAVHRDTHQIVPNLTLRVDPAVTPDDLLLDAIRTVATVAQPHLVNHPMMVDDLGERYGVVSCYNSLLVGGGAHTLVRLNLHEAARRHRGPSDRFVTDTLARNVELAAELMTSRIEHLVDEARFFDHSWLVREGLLSLDRFTAMFGIVGLAECVEHLLTEDGQPGRYGHDLHADDLAHRIVRETAASVHAIPMPYCEGTGGRALLHSQAGLERDVDLTAGTRVRAGDEPPLYRHITAVAPNHRWFPSGVSDVVRLDPGIAENPQAGVDIAKGAMSLGMRDVTFEVAGGEFVRITGYLARRRDVDRTPDERAATPLAVRHSSTVLAAGSFANAHLDTRSVQRVRCHELDAGSAR